MVLALFGLLDLQANLAWGSNLLAPGLFNYSNFSLTAYRQTFQEKGASRLWATPADGQCISGWQGRASSELDTKVAQQSILRPGHVALQVVAGIFVGTDHLECRSDQRMMGWRLWILWGDDVGHYHEVLP